MYQVRRNATSPESRGTLVAVYASLAEAMAHAKRLSDGGDAAVFVVKA